MTEGANTCPNAGKVRQRSEHDWKVQEMRGISLLPGLEKFWSERQSDNDRTGTETLHTSLTYILFIHTEPTACLHMVTCFLHAGIGLTSGCVPIGDKHISITRQAKLTCPTYHLICFSKFFLFALCQCFFVSFQLIETWLISPSVGSELKPNQTMSLTSSCGKADNFR